MRVRKRWLALGLLLAVVAVGVALYARDAYQRASYYAELGSLPSTPCVEALTSPPLSELPIYIAGGYDRSFPGTGAAVLFDVLEGLDCSKSELLPFFFQFPSSLEEIQYFNENQNHAYIINYRDIYNESIFNRILFYFGILNYYFYVFFEDGSDEFQYVTMWPR